MKIELKNIIKGICLNTPFSKNQQIDNIKKYISENKLMEKVSIKLLGINIQKMMNTERRIIIIFIKQNILLKLKLLIKLVKII